MVPQIGHSAAAGALSVLEWKDYFIILQISLVYTAQCLLFFLRPCVVWQQYEIISSCLITNPLQLPLL